MFDSWSQAPAMDRSDKNGFRCAVYPGAATIPEAAFQTARFQGIRSIGETVDFAKPVDEAIYQVYKEQFSYDHTDLSPSLPFCP